MSVAGEPLLNIDGVSRSFGGVAAVDDVSFAVRSGQIVAVIGPNGAGKTTLFNLVTGLLRPQSGQVLLRGTAITRLGPHRIAALGMVRTFQLVRLFPRMTTLENVLVGFHLRTRGGVFPAVARPRWYRGQEAAIRDRADALLALVGLAHRRDALAANLTYGQQRQLEIARALAAEPSLLLLDEPAAGLNGPETRGLSELIVRIRNEGITVLFIEHDMNLVMDIAEQIHVLDFGRLIASGTPAEVRRSPAVIEAYLGRAAMADAVQEP